MGYPLFYSAWNTSSNGHATGDGGNHTIVVETVAPDGTPYEITGLTPTELGNGAYMIEPDDEDVPPGYAFKVRGSSSTANVVLFGDGGRRPLGDAGTGARTITITVDDGSDPIEGATVRLTNGGVSHVYTTNVSGQVTANVDDATWTIAITHPANSYAGTTLLVDGDKSPTYSMTPRSITAPTNPASCTCYIKTVDYTGADDPGAVVNFRMTTPPTTDGLAHPSNVRKVTSDDDAMVEIELPQGAVFSYWRGNDERNAGSFTVPAQATFELDEIAGTDET